jgi:hypothetical protein
MGIGVQASALIGLRGRVRLGNQLLQFLFGF